MAITKVTTDVITDGAVTAPKLATDSVTADKLAANSVTAAKIAAGTLTDQVANNSITAAKIPNATALTLDGGVTIDNINIDGTTMALSSGDLTLDVAGDIILDADGGDIIFKDGGTAIAQFWNANSGDFYIGSQVSNKDFYIRGNDNGSGVNAVMFDMSAAGAATFNDSVTIPSDIIHSGDTDTILQFNANDSWRVITGDEERFKVNNGEVVVNDNSVDMDFRVESNGNANMLFVDGGNNVVGIGGTPQTTVGKLDIIGQSNNYNTAPMLTFKTTSTNAANRNWSIGALDINYGDFHIGCGDSNSDFFDASAHSKFTIDKDGNVGIGTTAPQAHLDINTETAEATTVILNGEVNQDKILKFRHQANSEAAGDGYAGFIGSVVDNVLTLGHYNSSNTEVQALHIDESGKVGIGTSAPEDYNSHAENLVVASSGNTGITIAAGTTSDSTLMFADGTGGTAGYRGRVGYDHNTDYMAFHTAAEEKMRITANGFVSVARNSGVPSDMAGLQVASGGLLINGTENETDFHTATFQSNYWTYFGTSGATGGKSGSFRITVPNCTSGASNIGYGSFSVEVYLSGYNGAFCHAMLSGYQNSGINIGEAVILRSGGSHSVTYGGVGAQGFYFDIDIASYTHPSAYYRITKAGDNSSDHETDMKDLTVAWS